MNPQRGSGWPKVPVTAVVAGTDVALFFRHPHCPRVGRVLAVRLRTIALTQWGRTDASTFDRSTITFARRVGHCPEWQREHISAQQRTGGCGLLVSRRRAP